MTPSTAELINAKQALRATVTAARDALSPNVRKVAADTIMRRVLSLDIYHAATSVLTYMSFGNELNTHHFFDTLLRDGKTVMLPRIDKASNTLTLHRVNGHDDLVDGIWGIREPHPDSPKVALADVDMMMMPGLAFDRAGNRLGYGAGYYDRLLAPLADKAVRPLRLVAAFDCQVVDAVPVGPSDQPFHILVTETQLYQLPQSPQSPSPPQPTELPK